MITNFENITYELNKYETQTLLPLVLRGLRYKYGKKMAVTNKTAIEALKLRGCVISSPRFRKIVQYIRINNLINNLISTKKGYYIAITEEERMNYLESLRQRIQSMTATYDAMEHQRKTTMVYNR